MAFETAKRFSDNIAKLPSGRELFIEAMKQGQVSAQIIDLNQKQMYDFGVDSKGVTLGEYAPLTKMLKAQKGQKISNVTLKDTGEFYDSMKVKFEFQILITGDMKKPDTDLETIYPFALGLTEENKEEILPEIKERIIENIRKSIAA